MAEVMEPTRTGGPAAAAHPTMTPEELAPHFPQLEILECLGRGGMGVVYKARQKSLNRLVALKLLAPERVTDAQFAERFAREAHALAALNHPHIVTVHDFGTVDAVLARPGDAAAAPTPLYFLLMEFVDGVNLRQAMGAGRFTPEQALSVVPPICEALQYAHEQGVVHRDIKPENLLLDKAGRVKIADFGIAKMLDETSGVGVEETQPAGTPQYMAPEQTAHRRTDHRADIYSLGVVLYEMLTGELPAAQIQPPSRKVQIDVRLDEIVLRALERTPELRYQTAAEMRTQVEAMAQPAPEPEADVAKPAGEARFSRPAIWGAAWAPLFFIAFVMFFWATASEVGEYRGPASWQKILAFAVLPLGVAAPFGTTILGWISTAQIRRSGGRIYGLGLAVFDGLLFPLLALDGLILWLITTGAHLYFETYASRSVHHRVDAFPGGSVQTADYPVEHAELAVLAAILVALAVDYFIVRRVWRGMQGLKRPEPPVARPRISRPTSGLAALSLAIAGLLMVGLLGLLDWSAQADLPRLEEPHNPFPLPVPVSAGLVIACGLLAYLLEVPALIMGVLARRTAFGKAATILALVAISLPIAGLVDWTNTRQRLVQADLDRRGELTRQMGKAINEHLAAAHLASGVQTYSVSSDGDYVMVQMHNVTSTEPGRKTVFAEGRIHGLDRGRGDWWVQGEGPLGHIAFRLAGQVLSHNADERFHEIVGRPYPVRTLVRASDGTTFDVPDLAAFLPQVRRLPDYAEWRKVRGISTLYVTNRSDYRCEVHFGGQMPDQSGRMQDWITEIDLMRPNRSRLARIEVPTPDAERRWSTRVFDSAGERELVRVVWKSGRLETEDVIDSIIRDPGEPAEMAWSVSQGGTIEDKAHAFVAPATPADLAKNGVDLTGPATQFKQPELQDWVRKRLTSEYPGEKYRPLEWGQPEMVAPHGYVAIRLKYIYSVGEKPDHYFQGHRRYLFTQKGDYVGSYEVDGPSVEVPAPGGQARTEKKQANAPHRLIAHPWLDGEQAAPTRPWELLLAAAKNGDRGDSPEAQLALLRELQLALDTNPPRGGELLIRNEMTHTMSGGFTHALRDEAISWLTETLERFKDVPTATGVLYAKVRLAELLNVSDDREHHRAQIAQLLAEALGVTADQISTESDDGQILSAAQIREAPQPARDLAKLAADDSPNGEPIGEWTQAYRAQLEQNRRDRFERTHEAAAQVLARAQYVQNRLDLTRVNLLKLRSERHDDASYQSAITAYLADVEKGIAAEAVRDQMAKATSPTEEK